MKNTKAVLSFLAIGAAIQPLFAGDNNKPNILIIMTDQMRADVCRREGFPLNTTPFLDSLAQKGCWFNKAYTSAPASVPARTSLMTGRFPKATDVRSNHNVQDAKYEDDLYGVMKKAGYRTALVGKNHTYMKAGRVDYWDEYGHTGKMSKDKTPEEAAFDKYLGTLSMYENDKPSPFGVELQQPYRMVDEATAWIKQAGNQPFFMLFSMPEPHTPYQVCEPYYSMFPPETLPPIGADIHTLKGKGEVYQHMHDVMVLAHPDYEKNINRTRSVYYGMLRMIDDQVRRLVGQLKEEGVLDNTIIVFLSDHGDYVGEYGLIKKGVGLPDVLSRIPMFWYGPGIKTDAEPSQAHVSIVDLLPTLCEITGQKIPMGVQGRSLWNLLQGKAYPEEEFASVMAEGGYGGAFYTAKDGTDYEGEGCLNIKRGTFDSLNSWTQSGSLRLLRKGDWKLIYDMTGHGELYHVSADPSEINNLYDDAACNSVKQDLLQDLLKWEIATQDPLPVPRNRYYFKRNPHNYLFEDETR